MTETIVLENKTTESGSDGNDKREMEEYTVEKRKTVDEQSRKPLWIERLYSGTHWPVGEIGNFPDGPVIVWATILLCKIKSRSFLIGDSCCWVDLNIYLGDKKLQLKCFIVLIKSNQP